MNHDLRGNRYLAYARCAAADGSATKLEVQIRRIRQFGDGLNMRCAGEVRLAGVGGWFPALRPDLRALLARKRERDDFDVLIMEDVVRLTRTGLDGARAIESTFRECGVEILYLAGAMRATEGVGADDMRASTTACGELHGEG